MLLFPAAQGWLPSSAVSAPCEFTSERPGSIIARLRHRWMHAGSGIDQKLGGGGEVKLFRGGASWRRRRLFAFPPVKTRCRLLVMLAPAMWRCFPGTRRDSPRWRGCCAENRSPHTAIQALWGLCRTWSIVLLPRLCFTCTPGIALYGRGHP